jgi:hypothetical protein
VRLGATSTTGTGHVDSDIADPFVAEGPTNDAVEMEHRQPDVLIQGTTSRSPEARGRRYAADSANGGARATTGSSVAITTGTVVADPAARCS